MNMRIVSLVALTSLLILAAACSQDNRLASPENLPTSLAGQKNGTETLGAPSIAISGGTGFAEGGVGMVGISTGVLVVDVPQDVMVAQVLLYWAGGTTGAAGDDEIMLDGSAVSGELIGGPTPFFTSGGVEYFFSAYRADITDLGLIQVGPNSVTVSGFDFDTSGGILDENNGCSIVVITDDGSAAELNLRDGLDMAYFDFAPTLDSTIPQTFGVTAADVDRLADLLVLAGSVGQERPNRIVVTTSMGDQNFDNALGSNDGLTWDSLVLSVTIPAGDTSVTVQVISIDSVDAQGASLGWVAAGLAVELPAPPTEDVSGTVFVDADNNGEQGMYESGIGNVVLDIDDGQGNVATVVTDADGHYVYGGLGGAYTVTIDLAAHLDAFNDDLGSSFAPTTPLSVVVNGATFGVDFGFVPVAEAILADLDFGELSSNARPVAYWVKLFRRGIIEEDSGRQAVGHDNGSGTDTSEGWGHDENYLSVEQLHLALDLLATLYQPEPYQFTPGNELKEAYDLLKARPRTDIERLYRELFVTELNFVTNLGLVDEADRLAVLISWGESLLVTEPANKAFEKDRASDLWNAITIFEAVNTGGGAGVDE